MPKTLSAANGQHMFADDNWVKSPYTLLIIRVGVNSKTPTPCSVAPFLLKKRERELGSFYPESFVFHCQVDQISCSSQTDISGY